MKVAPGLLILPFLLLVVCFVEGGKNKNNAAGEDGDNVCIKSIKKKGAQKTKICELERRLQVVEALLAEEEHGGSEEEEGEEPELFGQWVLEVPHFSSQYTPTSYSAAKIAGEPDVYPSYADRGYAWCPKTTNQPEEFLEVKFAAAVVPKMFSIYETWHGGSIHSIQAKNPAGAFEKIIDDRTPQYITYARIFNVTISNVNFAADTYRISLQCQGKWVEIDAMRLYGLIQ